MPCPVVSPTLRIVSGNCDEKPWVPLSRDSDRQRLSYRTSSFASQTSLRRTSASFPSNSEATLSVLWGVFGGSSTLAIYTIQFARKLEHTRTSTSTLTQNWEHTHPHTQTGAYAQFYAHPHTKTGAYTHFYKHPSHKTGAYTRLQAPELAVTHASTNTFRTSTNGVIPWIEWVRTIISVTDIRVTIDSDPRLSPYVDFRISPSSSVPYRCRTNPTRRA